MLTEDGSEPKPAVSVSSVTSGDRVEVYQSSTNCVTRSSAVGSGTVAADSTALQVTVSELVTGGEYQFYARATDLAGNFSVCSDVSDTYLDHSV